MKIELQEPFKSLWRNGYLITNRENRRHVCLVNNDGDRTTISYARYLMGVKLGAIVSSDFEVDHKDDDKTNDDINNLQLLTKLENSLKENERYRIHEQVRYTLHCTNCESPFILTEREWKMRVAQNLVNICCSRSCSGQYAAYMRVPR